jgi:transcriptional regulator with XRE-family HTH domain
MQISTELGHVSLDAEANVGLPRRLERLMQIQDLNQSQFAKRIGISSGFMSDVMRGTKQPGMPFFLAAKREFNVSLDWLLSGKGTPSGDTLIRMDLIRSVRLFIALARTAFQGNNPQAKALLKLLQDEQLHALGNHQAVLDLLENTPEDHRDFSLALELYNGHILTSDPTEQRRNLLAGAVAHFERNFPASAVQSMGLRPSEPTVQQSNTGANQRIAGRDFNER